LRERTEPASRLVALLAARILLVTLTLGAVVALHAASAHTEELTQPFGWFVSSLIALVYVLSIGYALMLRRVRDPVRFGAVQLVGDIAVVTALVHVTGGAESGFASMYILIAVAANVIGLPRWWARAAVIACAGAYLSVSIAGYLGLLPALIGQPFLPWETTPQSASRAVVINLVALGATALLAGNLAEQARRARERAAAARSAALDMAALAEDIVRSLSSGLLTLDQAGVIMSVNGAAAEILGLPGQALIGQPLVELAPEIAPWLERAAREPVRRSEVDVQRGDRLYHLGVTVSPLTDGTGRVRGRVVNFSDLTELKRKDLELKQKERLAAIGRLAAGVAHEIRNPLAAISGSIELLAGAQLVGEENQQLMQIVLREVDRLNRMIADLLTYARPRQPELQAIDLGGLLEETVRVFQQDRTQPGVAVRLEPPARALRALVDPGQIRQVAWNLMRNGAEAMPGGGEIEVRLLDGEGAAGFEVTDQGQGIARDDLDRVFDPFFTTKDTGTGLGLATVHRIVQDHGGRVEIASALGKGTRVRVWLPAVQAAAATG